MSNDLHSKLDGLQGFGLIAGGVGVLVCVLGLILNPTQFFISWLFGWTFWLGLSLGCFGVAMIHHLTGGKWGFVTRRFLEAGFLVLPLMAVLFIPICFGLRDLYPWARPEAVAASDVLQRKHTYLNVPGFTVRAVIFFAIWLLMAFYLRKWSLQQDATRDPDPTIRLRTLSGPGVVIYALTGTFAFVDWVMSIEPEWFSSVFLVIVLIGQILTAFAFVTILLGRFRTCAPFSEVVSTRHFHDLGNLLLTFVMFWTYVSFGQVLIIYSGNLPREIDWYLHRIHGSWKWIVWLLALFHFFLPFFLLLFRAVKRNVSRLIALAVLLFAVHAIAVYWLIAPTFHREGIHVHWLDLSAFAGIGGLWLARFAVVLKRAPLLPQNDPRIDYSVSTLAHAEHQ